jgi:hypothetical protein
MAAIWTWKKWLVLSLGLLVGTTWFWLACSPAHWMRRVDFGTVKVDGRQVQANIYIGHPTYREAEAIALVHLADGHDYFLDFDSEKVRQGSRWEYIHLLGGVWCFRPMQDGSFQNPLPFLEMNQFRIASQNGHIVTVQF